MDGVLDGRFDGTLHVRGDLGRKLDNKLTMTFRTGPEDELGRAVQSAGDGVGKKLGVLFGFKNGGTGTHVFTGANGATIEVESPRAETSTFRSGDGTVLGEARRMVWGTEETDLEANRSTVHDAAGNLVFEVRPSASGARIPPEGRPPEIWRTDLIDASGAVCGGMDLVRTSGGWSLGQELLDEAIWFGHAGKPLQMPVVGTALTFLRQPTAIEGDLAIGMCIDLGIGLRPYVAEMT